MTVPWHSPPPSAPRYVNKTIQQKWKSTWISMTCNILEFAKQFHIHQSQEKSLPLILLWSGEVGKREGRTYPVFSQRDPIAQRPSDCFRWWLNLGGTTLHCKQVCAYTYVLNWNKVLRNNTYPEYRWCALMFPVGAWCSLFLQMHDSLKWLCGSQAKTWRMLRQITCDPLGQWRTDVNLGAGGRAPSFKTPVESSATLLYFLAKWE